MPAILAQAFLTELRVNTAGCDQETTMKRASIAFVIALLAQSVFAGYRYKVESITSGMQDSTTSGVAEVEGKNLRFDVEHGDGAVFTDSSFVVSTNGGRTLSVVDPSSKTYFEISLDQLSGGISTMMQSMGGMMKMTVANPKVSVRDLGNGDKIEGYDTQRKAIDASYDMNIEMMGQKMAMNMSMSTESWMTSQIPLDSASFLQTGELHTGIPEIDKLLALQAKSLNGFPLKQVTMIHINQMGQQMDIKTTTNVSGIEKKTIAASQFVVPAGYTKTDSPIDKMLKAMSGVGAPPRQ
jgi:hypothetical protein